MKKIFAVLLLSGFCAGAFAQSATYSTSTADSAATSTHRGHFWNRHRSPRHPYHHYHQGGNRAYNTSDPAFNSVYKGH